MNLSKSVTHITISRWEKFQKLQYNSSRVEKNTRKTQRCIENPVKDLRWSVLRKYLTAKKPLTIFAKRFILDVWQDFKYAPEKRHFYAHEIWHYPEKQMFFQCLSRSTACGFHQGAGIAGMMVAPWIALWLKIFHASLPFYCLGSATITASVLMIMIGETNKKKFSEGTEIKIDEPKIDEEKVSQKESLLLPITWRRTWFDSIDSKWRQNKIIKATTK